MLLVTCSKFDRILASHSLTHSLSHSVSFSLYVGQSKGCKKRKRGEDNKIDDSLYLSRVDFGEKAAK